MKRNIKYLPLKEVLEKKFKEPGFRMYFEESRSISQLCMAVSHARLLLGVSQAELAKKICTTQSVIARLENGNNGRIPSLDLLARIASALKLHLVVGFENKKAA